MHGNMNTHPDALSIARQLERTMRAHNRNSTFANTMMLSGTIIFTIGSVVSKVQSKGWIK